MKKTIETAQGSDIYPAAQQMLIYQGKVLKDGSTLEENNVAENSYVVIMLTKVKLDMLLVTVCMRKNNPCLPSEHYYRLQPICLSFVSSFQKHFTLLF